MFIINAQHLPVTALKTSWQPPTSRLQMRGGLAPPARHELRWPTESALAFVKTLPDFFYGLANLPLFSGHAEDEGQGRSPDLNVYFSDV